jgi:error-prone DNA polymerase
LSIEDETGIANAIITPDLFDTHHVTIVHKPFLLLDGMLQNQDGVISVKVSGIEALTISKAETTSHDFH